MSSETIQVQPKPSHEAVKAYELAEKALALAVKSLAFAVAAFTAAATVAGVCAFQ